MTILVNAKTQNVVGSNMRSLSETTERLEREGWRFRVRKGIIYILGHRSAHVRAYLYGERNEESSF